MSFNFKYTKPISETEITYDPHTNITKVWAEAISYCLASGKKIYVVNPYHKDSPCTDVRRELMPYNIILGMKAFCKRTASDTSGILRESYL